MLQMELEIKVDDLCGPEIALFLEEHIADMKAVSPPESKHALDIEGLRQPEITFWTVWHGATLVGCGAIKELDAQHAEVKSMRIASSHRGKGVASTLLQHIVSQATQRGYKSLSLETGSMPFFEPARKLYEKFGFRYCAPFAGYKADENSVFMTKSLSGKSPSVG
jgi:putative acetyltransferase